MRKSHTGQLSMSAGNPFSLRVLLKHHSTAGFDGPSSRMTLSPKTVISNFPVASSRERMLRMGRERALRSMAATPASKHSNVQSFTELGDQRGHLFRR